MMIFDDDEQEKDTTNLFVPFYLLCVNVVSVGPSKIDVLTKYDYTSLTIHTQITNTKCSTTK